MRDDAPDPRPLAVVTVSLTVAAALGVLPRWPGLVHLVALSPLDLLADLRALLAFAPGYPSFVVGAVVSLGVRGVVLAGLLGRLDRVGVSRTLRWLAALWPAALLAALALHAAAATLFYGFFWLGVVLSLVLALSTVAVPWVREQAGLGLRVLLRHRFRSGTVLAYLAVLAGLGALADVTGPAGSVALIPVSALVSWGAVQVLADPDRLRRIRRVIAVASVAGLTALAAVAATGPAQPPDTPGAEAPRDGSLLLMSGIDSRSGSGAILELDPRTLGHACESTHQYSYAGPGDGQPAGEGICPSATGAPYEEHDTLRSREELVPFLEQQLVELEPPVTLMTHSQGVWLAWAAATKDRTPGVETLVLVGAFPDNPAAFTVEGSGPGRVTADALRLVDLLGRLGGTGAFEVGAPLTQEWLAHPDAIERTLSRPLPDDMRALSVPSLFDVPLLPRDPSIDGAVDACPVPVIHPDLPYSPELLEAVNRHQDGQALPACPVWRSAVGPAFRHLTPPPVS
jgi:hypothetical protein